MIFKDYLFLLLIPIVFGFIFFLRKKDRVSAIEFSSLELITNYKQSFKLLLAKNLIYLRLVILILFILALARLRAPIDDTKVRVEGIDIVLAVDSSGSMLAEDFKIAGNRQNRLEAAKEVIDDFIKTRANDRFGLVTFAARAYTVCPLTLDHAWVLKNLERVEIGNIEDGTAIGSAISSSLNRIKNTEAKSKIIILLTDGVNNAGKISPAVAAEAAKALGVKIYAIGIGTKGLVPYPMKGFRGRTVYQKVKIDIGEDVLKEISDVTGGKYFRAKSTESLKSIYNEIDKLEKVSIEESGFREYKELFPIFLILGLILLLFEIVLSNTVLRKIP